MRKALEHFFIMFILEEELDKAMIFFVKKLVDNLLKNNVVTALNGIELEKYIFSDRLHTKDQLITNLNSSNKNNIENTIYLLIPLALRVNVDLYDLTREKVNYILNIEQD